mmetsp:Transcript_12339/g.20650  ORF Transcript_12339/g.20650 Transcript_12339/m.20650 type:complete len:431 (+) Transcript_12339:77-1369(+)
MLREIQSWMNALKLSPISCVKSKRASSSSAATNRKSSSDEDVDLSGANPSSISPIQAVKHTIDRENTSIDLQRYNEWILIPILSEWISTLDLSALDRALYNRKYRENMLRIFQHKNFSTHGIPKLPKVRMKGFRKWLNNHQIKVREISFRYYYTDSIGFREFLTKNVKLETLTVSDCSTMGSMLFTELGLTLGCLKELNIMDCSGVKHFVDVASPDGVSAPVQYSTPQRIFPRLEHLNLGACSGIETSVLEILAVNCRNLKHVDVHGCRRITDEAISALALNCPSLQHVNVRYCPQLTDAAIASLAENSHRLTSLNVGGCSQVTDAAILLISQRLCYLEHLDIGGCSNISDASLYALATHHIGETLKDIRMACCRKFTASAIRNLVENCRNLDSLNIRYCNCTRHDVRAYELIASERKQQLSVKFLSVSL